MCSTNDFRNTHLKKTIGQICVKNKKRTYADALTLVGTADLQINAHLLPTCLAVRMEAKYLVFMFVLL